MKRIAKRILNAYLAVVASRTLEFILTMAFMFYFSVSLSMYNNGCEIWHEKPHSIIFFAPMGIVLLATVISFLVHLLKNNE